jgi:hypothetical protein
MYPAPHAAPSGPRGPGACAPPTAATQSPQAGILDRLSGSVDWAGLMIRPASRPQRSGGEPMSHPVIPAPVRFDGGGGEFVFRPGTTVAYSDAAVAPIVERFCSEVTRRTGLRLAPHARQPGSERTVRQGRAWDGGRARRAPAPAGVSAAGGPPDERHALAIDADQVVVRAVEPVGVARGLTTLLQLAATPSAGNAGELTGRADPRRAEIRLARSVAGPRPHVLHPGRGPAGTWRCPTPSRRSIRRRRSGRAASACGSTRP